MSGDKEFYEFRTGNKPVRIKANETFEVKVALPRLPCPCGNPFEKLSLFKIMDDDREVAYFQYRCKKCGREAPDNPDCIEPWLAVLSWSGAVSAAQAEELRKEKT